MSALSLIDALQPERIQRRDQWLRYLARRTGNFHMRARRYASVATELGYLGLRDGDLVVDVGAGMCEFGKYLYASGWSGRYVPVDATIDGMDLEIWTPKIAADFFVCIETLEHLGHPEHLLKAMREQASKGVVITTPNPAVVDVLAMDETHVTPIHDFELSSQGWRVNRLDLFGKPEDTLLASWEAV